MPLPIGDIAAKLFSAADTVCLERATLVTQAYERYGNLPRPQLRARALQHVLQHMTLDLDTNPVFAGNTSTRPRAWMLVPEHGFGMNPQVAVEHDELRHLMDGKVPAQLQAFWQDRAFGNTPGGWSGIGHLAIDQDLVVNKGLASVLQELSQHAEDPDPQRREYREAMRTSLQAVIAWAHRYADAAEVAAASAEEAWRRDCLLRVARACRHVPEHPARDLHEGLQAIALTHLAISIEGHGMSISIGLPDRALARFESEAAADPAAAAELVAAFLLAIAANSFMGRGSKTQAVTIGGRDAAGHDCCNAITVAFLDALRLAPVSDPHLFLRWHRGLPADVRQRVAKSLSGGRSMPLLVSDEPTTAGFIAAGIAPGDAFDYCVIGCNELGIPGRNADTGFAIAGAFNDCELLFKMLTGSTEWAGIATLAQLFAKLEQQYEAHFREGLPRRTAAKRAMVAAVPTPFTSALMRGAAKRGCDFLQSMPYQQPGSFTRGFTDAVNSLLAINAAVFSRREFTLAEVAEAMLHDRFTPRLREALANSPRWGNDDDAADAVALELLEVRQRALQRVADELGLLPPMVCHVVRSLHHLDGRRVGATPDGRSAGEPMCDSIGARTGTAHEGPTAILNSVLKIDASRYFRGGYNLNITLSGDHGGPQVLQSLIEGFLEEGGQELQVNVLDEHRLRDAMAHPERHRDLVVRMAGLSARFVELSRIEQEELVERARCAR
jgi:formate C-acetyltransferase